MKINLGMGPQPTPGEGVIISWVLWGNPLMSEPYSRDAIVEPFVQAALQRQQVLVPGQSWYRARLMPPGHMSWDPSHPATLKDMGPPPVSGAHDGRLHKPGQPAFYLSSDAATAVAEMRPWPSAYVTVAEFRVITEVTVVDLTGKSEESYEPHAKWLSRLIATPVHPHDPDKYRDTQEFRRLLEDESVLGIIYVSSLSASGHNLALFGSDAMVPESSMLHRVHTVDVTHAAHIPGPKPDFGFGQPPSGPGLLGPTVDGDEGDGSGSP